MSVAIPQFMKTIQKSLYGTVRFAPWFDCCAHAHMGNCTRARRGEKHCLCSSADPDVLAEGSFCTPRVLCLLIFSRKLKQEERISFLNE
jgi:hypothetical protein